MSRTQIGAQRTMDADQATMLVSARIMNIDPKHGSKIIDYLLLNADSHTIISLASGPEVTLRYVVRSTKKVLGLRPHALPIPFPSHPTLQEMKAGNQQRFLELLKSPFEIPDAITSAGMEKFDPFLGVDALKQRHLTSQEKKERKQQQLLQVSRLLDAVLSKLMHYKAKTTVTKYERMFSETALSADKEKLEAMTNNPDVPSHLLDEGLGLTLGSAIELPDITTSATSATSAVTEKSEPLDKIPVTPFLGMDKSTKYERMFLAAALSAEKDKLEAMTNNPDVPSHLRDEGLGLTLGSAIELPDITTSAGMEKSEPFEVIAVQRDLGMDRWVEKLDSLSKNLKKMGKFESGSGITDRPSFSRLTEEWPMYEDFHKLLANLSSVRSTAADAERRRLKPVAVGSWLRRVGNVACRAIDALDELEGVRPGCEWSVLRYKEYNTFREIGEKFNRLAMEVTTIKDIIKGSDDKVAKEHSGLCLEEGGNGVSKGFGASISVNRQPSTERRGFMREEVPVLPLLDLIMENLKSLAEEGSLSSSDVGEELQKISATISTVRPAVEDAEQTQAKVSAARNWLQRLKDIAYEVDDMLDMYTTEALHPNINKQQVPRSSSSYGNSSLFELVAKCKITEVAERLDKVTKERISLHLKERGDGGSSSHVEEGWQTFSFVDESEVFGRHDDMENIVDLLLADEFRGKNASPIIIVGMGGVGKTTLAQLVYNDERVVKHFQLQAWVHVSKDFDAERLITSFIQSATGKCCQLEDIDSLRAELEGILRGKRYLLVLDDVWNPNDENAWDKLHDIFDCGATGSKIIITTRSRVHSSAEDAYLICNLEGLSYEDSWSLFQQRAFPEGSLHDHTKLATYGKQIVRKCKGLPLAVKALGDILRFKADEKDWHFISRSNIWDLPEDMNAILPALRSSYYQLPAPVKKCFAICAMFPEDYEYDKDELVLLWMAEGFLRPRGMKQMEDVGDEYFKELFQLLFFQISGINKSRYKMHEFIHGLAQSISGEECFMAEDGRSCNISKRARHAYLVSHHLEPKFFEAFYKATGLRTFLLRPYNKHPHLDVRLKQIVFDVPIKLRCVRMLDLSHTEIAELPDSIGKLKHLRYLNLSRSHIRRLPNSMSSLHNLQTLNLNYCTKLIELPKDLRNLINLRYLYLDVCLSQLICMPPGIGRLTFLQMLPYFVVGTQSGYRIREVGNMVHLRGTLSISKLENVVNMEEAKDANLEKKHQLHRLELLWSHDDANLRDQGTEEEILEGLQPHANLKELLIENYIGAKFPSWMMVPSLVNLVKIELSNCIHCEALPPFGELPFLKDLYLKGMHGVYYVGHDFYGEGVEWFPSLERLVFCAMAGLEEWVGLEEDEFPNLHKLRISYCPKLKHLPLFSPTLKKLEITSCEELAVIPNFPSVHDLKVKECDEGILSSLRYLTSLVSLTICQIHDLQFLPMTLLSPLKALKKLKIKECDDLMCLNEEDGLQDLTSLQHLEIEKCPLLTSMEDEKLPIALEYMRISSCLNLTALPKGLQRLTSLRHLEISDCPQLMYLPSQGLPSMLESLRIRGCYILEKRCQKEEGEDWCKIKDIPIISIEGYD